MSEPEVGKWYWVDTPAGMHRSHFLTAVPGGFKGQLYETDDREKFMWISRSGDVIAEVEPENIPKPSIVTRRADRIEHSFIVGVCLLIAFWSLALVGAWAAVVAILARG